MSGQQQSSSVIIRSGAVSPAKFIPLGHEGSQVEGNPSYLIFAEGNHNQTPAYYTSATNFQTTDVNNDSYNQINAFQTTQSNAWGTSTVPYEATQVTPQSDTAADTGHHDAAKKRTILDELVSKIDIQMALTFAFLVALATALCIMTEDCMPLPYALTAVSIISLGIFVRAGL